ncbi:YjgB family protein [Paenibacillus lignilyticus]|uniref:YjgB family protein n=1 Tax=Paenibacillus lignilyticus TaxID=1172615 RepID=A0ABS5CC27_9BACL|nr:YjgB family protein [Paenibacillus lignilyticus]MBP3963005.1 YjgB family protein [Paenibacillus lignilyticus]
MLNKSKQSYKLAAKLALTGLIAVSSMTAISHSNVHAAAASASTNAQNDYIKSLYKLASEGKIPGLNAIAGKTPISAVHYKWGEPDVGGDLKGNHYEGYNLGMGKGEYSFGVNKSGVIYDLRNFGTSVDRTGGVKSLTFASVIKTLGMPKEVRFTGTDKIYVYHPSKAYELKFVGPSKVAKGKIAHIDHINVYAGKANT